MSRIRHCQWIFQEKPEDHFVSAEEAWFWFVRTMKLRREGARFEFNAKDTARPCTPEDIARAVLLLSRTRKISNLHVRTLNRFGYLERPPDPRDRCEERAYLLWEEALDRLSTLLKSKGILEDVESNRTPIRAPS